MTLFLRRLSVYEFPHSPAAHRRLGDIIIYRTGFSADSQAKRDILKLPDDVKLYGKEALDALAPHDYLDWALSNCKTVMDHLTKDVFDPSLGHSLYVTGPGNYREKVATIKPYKGNRDPYAKPKYYQELKAYLTEHWGAVTIEGAEADDALGIEQYSNKDRSTCIVGIDKDMLMIPGYHFNWVKDEERYITKSEADLNFFRQMLEGDRTDNIPGIMGIGPKTVDKMIGACQGELPAFREVVMEQYRKQYGSEWKSAYEEIAKLLWIQRERGKSCPFLYP